MCLILIKSIQINSISNWTIIYGKRIILNQIIAKFEWETRKLKASLSNTTYKTYEKKLTILPSVFGIINPVIARSKQ